MRRRCVGLIPRRGRRQRGRYNRAMPGAWARGLYWFCCVTGGVAFLACVGLVALYVLTNEPGAKYLAALAAAVAAVAFLMAAAVRRRRHAVPPGFDIVTRPPSDT